MSSEVSSLQSKVIKSIAVLPFVNMSNDIDYEYFSDGITEEIINALTKIDGLKVTSRTSSFYFKNKQLALPEIGKALNVSAILEGSVRLSAKKIRITAQLIDVNDDVHFWSETFDRSVEHIFAVQDEISLLIAERLREHIGHFEINSTLIDSPQISINLYQKYLKGKYHLLRMSQQEVNQGLMLLEEVIQEAPHFALGHLGVHMAYSLIATLGIIPAQEAFAKGKIHLDKAIELSPTLPECQLNLAWVSFLQEWDLNKAYQHLNNLLSSQPIVEGYQTMASILVAEGRFNAAMQYIDTAFQLDPFSAINYHLKGFIYYVQDQFDEAIYYFEKSFELKPHHAISSLYRGQALLLAGKLNEGLEFVESIPESPADHALLRIGGMTMARVALGQQDLAQEGIEKLEMALEGELMEQAMNLLILCQAMIGNEKEALKRIRQAIEMHLPMIVYLKEEPILSALKNKPAFQELMKAIFGSELIELEPKRKYKKSLLAEADLAIYKTKLTELMEQSQPYLNSALTLKSLAEMLSISANHLSQLLNEGFNQNFSGYINNYRLAAFKEKVADPKQQHLTLLALAYESGFNSKTVFNTFFKKMEGKTPKAYFKEITHK